MPVQDTMEMALPLAELVRRVAADGRYLWLRETVTVDLDETGKVPVVNQVEATASWQASMLASLGTAPAVG